MKKSLILLCAQWAITDEGYSIQMQKSTSQLVDELGLRGKIFFNSQAGARPVSGHNDFNGVFTHFRRLEFLINNVYQP